MPSPRERGEGGDPSVAIASDGEGEVCFRGTIASAIGTTSPGRRFAASTLSPAVAAERGSSTRHLIKQVSLRPRRTGRARPPTAPVLPAARGGAGPGGS